MFVSRLCEITCALVLHLNFKVVVCGAQRLETANDDERLWLRDLFNPKQFCWRYCYWPIRKFGDLVCSWGEGRANKINDNFNLRTEDLLADAFPQEKSGQGIIAVTDNELLQKDTSQFDFTYCSVVCNIFDITK